MGYSVRCKAALFAVVVFVVFFMGSATVVGDSMNPWYRDGDFLLLLRVKSVSHGDVVAVYSDVVGKTLCKRVVAMSGDEVVVDDGIISVNGLVLDEWYLSNGGWDADPVASLEGADVLSLDKFHIRVRDGYLFVLGDNRGISLDSRKIGCVGQSGIHGKVLLNVTRISGLGRKGFWAVVVAVWGMVLFFPRGKVFRHGKRGI